METQFTSLSYNKDEIYVYPGDYTRNITLLNIKALIYSEINNVNINADILVPYLNNLQIIYIGQVLNINNFVNFMKKICHIAKYIVILDKCKISMINLEWCFSNADHIEIRNNPIALEWIINSVKNIGKHTRIIIINTIYFFEKYLDILDHVLNKRLILYNDKYENCDTNYSNKCNIVIKNATLIRN